jgi:hypothetical protein
MGTVARLLAEHVSFRCTSVDRIGIRGYIPGLQYEGGLVKFHFTPTSSSWLNLVERWFAELTRRLLQRSAHRTVKALTTDLNAWVASWNDDPRPFVWHKSADEILENLAGYLQRISGAGTSNMLRKSSSCGRCGWRDST